MAGRRDIHESIRLLLGKNTKVLLKVPVKLELKHGDKTENRILVFTPHRLFIVTAKVPSRIDHQFHYLDIRCVESKAPNHIAFSFANLDKTFSFRPNYEQLDQSNSASTFDRLIQVLADAVRRIFPGMTKSLNFSKCVKKKFVKVCLRFSQAVQISLQFDEFFFNFFCRCSIGAYHWKIRGDAGWSDSAYHWLDAARSQRCWTLWRFFCPILMHVRLLLHAIQGGGGVGRRHHLLFTWLTWIVSPGFRAFGSSWPHMHK